MVVPAHALRGLDAFASGGTGDGEQCSSCLRVCTHRWGRYNDGERLHRANRTSGSGSSCTRKPVLGYFAQCLSVSAAAGVAAQHSRFSSASTSTSLLRPCPMNCAAGDTCQSIPSSPAAPSMGDGHPHACTWHSPIPPLPIPSGSSNPSFTR